MKAFRDTYLKSSNSERIRVLDLGAAVYLNQKTYKTLFDSDSFEYVGVDMADGTNVDIVLADPHHWVEIPSSSYDVVISGQTFEHDPYFWVTMCEIGRVLKPGGWCCIIAPSRGPAHFFPFDCWRFYPDSGAAMMSFAGLDVVESFVEPGTFRGRAGIEWGDMVVVGRLPEMNQERYSQHLERIGHAVSSVPAASLRSEKLPPGPMVVAYQGMGRKVWGFWRPYIFRKAFAHLRMRIWNGASPRQQAWLSRFR